jgi:hypothetical protein
MNGGVSMVLFIGAIAIAIILTAIITTLIVETLKYFV